MILKFCFKEGFEKIIKDINDNFKRITDETNEKLENERMGNISLNIEEYNDISTNFNIKKAIASVKIENQVFVLAMKSIAELAIQSVNYIWSILKEKGEIADGNGFKNFVFGFSNKTDKEKDFIYQWLKIRNSWTHESKFPEDKNFISKYYPNRGIEPFDFREIIEPIFNKIEEKFPGVDLDGGIDIDKIPGFS